MRDPVIEAKAFVGTIERLVDRITQLEEIVGLGESDIALIIRCFDLTKTEATILNLLRKRRVTLSVFDLHLALYGAREEEDVAKSRTVQMMISHIRAKLRKRDQAVDITNMHGVGYYLTDEARDRLTTMMKAQLEEVAA